MCKSSPCIAWFQLRFRCERETSEIRLLPARRQRVKRDWTNMADSALSPQRLTDGFYKQHWGTTNKGSMHEYGAYKHYTGIIDSINNVNVPEEGFLPYI